MNGHFSGVSFTFSQITSADALEAATYTEVVSAANAKQCKNLRCANSSTQAIIVALGAAAGEVVYATIPASTDQHDIPYTGQGRRIAIKSAGTDISVGTVVINACY